MNQRPTYEDLQSKIEKQREEMDTLLEDCGRMSIAYLALRITRMEDGWRAKWRQKWQKSDEQYTSTDRRLIDLSEKLTSRLKDMWDTTARDRKELETKIQELEARVDALSKSTV